MKSIINISEKINDSLNPIVVKELRQAVQGKFLVVVLMLFLILQLFTMGAFLTGKTVSWRFDAGRDIFIGLLGILLGTCLLFVPAYAGIRLASERSDANVDLLFITTLRPRAIIWGKFLAALIVTVLIYSACMPFMTFTYLLRGIDLPSIFVLLGLDFIVVAASIQCAILIGCISANRVFKAILGVIWLGVMIAVFVMTTGWSFALLNSGIGSELGSWEFWRPALSILASGLAFIGLLSLLSIAAISPPSANRALPVRIFIVAVWLLTGVSLAIWSKVENSYDPIVAWVILHVILHCIGLFIAVNERESWGRRVLQSIPHRSQLRSLAFLFYSGAAGGVAWSSLMIILTLSLALAWEGVFPNMRVGGDFHEILEAMAGMGLYAFSYALGASLIRRRFLADRVTGAYTWVIALVMLAIATTIPPLIAFFFLSAGWSSYSEAGGWLVGNPLALFMGGGYRSMCIEVMSVCAIFVGALNLLWFIRQIDSFRPPRRKAGDGQDGEPQISNTT